jgi:hypothetical protein
MPYWPHFMVQNPLRNLKCFFKADWSGLRTQRTSTYQWINSMWPHIVKTLLLGHVDMSRIRILFMVFLHIPPKRVHRFGGICKKTMNKHALVEQFAIYKYIWVSTELVKDGLILFAPPIFQAQT